jgi:hypothetical protein
MSYGSDFVLTLFTNDPALARRADEAGIDRIGLDLERHAKTERQDGRKTWISDHEEDDLPAIAGSLARAKLFVRTDPVHDGLKEEIDRVIGMGAQVLMLPYFHDADEAARFVEFVGGRATVSLLLETAQAAARIRDIVRLDGVDEIHVGLNDLYLTLGLSSHFEVLASSLLDMLSDVVVGAGIPFGFGGIGRLGDDRLPVSSDLVYAQHPRLGSTRALVSRVFLSPDPSAVDIAAEIARFRARLDYWASRSAEELAAAREALHREAQRQARA